MKRSLVIYLAAALLAAQTAAAQENCGLRVDNASMERNAGLMTVSMALRFADFDLDGNRVAVFTPAIVGPNDSLMLRSVGLYSRNRWYQYLRADQGPVSGPDETPIRWSQRPEALDYSETVPYAEWMNGAQLVLLRRDYACCRRQIDGQESPLAGYREVHFSPVFRYAQPAVGAAETAKTRELSGRAFIDFPVNRTEIYPDYRNNTFELTKIVATIDSVRNDQDVTVRRITIKGYASPEGSYENNIRLAKGRTEALKQYVQQLYSFPSDFIGTDYEPEDWGGLRDAVEASNLPNRSGLLTIINDSTLDPDPKDWRLKMRYPADYKYLLETVYPALRHSDYTIEYTIRSFTDAQEIGRLFYTAPHKLNLSEMLLYAQSLEPGSDAYNDVFETAVRIYPESEVANLNAANAAMQRNDLRSAERYLAKAGESGEARYARGMLAALQGDYDRAIRFVRASQLDGSAEMAAHLEEVKKYQ